MDHIIATLYFVPAFAVLLLLAATNREVSHNKANIILGAVAWPVTILIILAFVTVALLSKSHFDAHLHDE